MREVELDDVIGQMSRFIYPITSTTIVNVSLDPDRLKIN